MSIAAVGFRLASQQIFQTEILRAIDTPYQVVVNPDGRRMVINHFKVNWSNVSAYDASVEIVLPKRLQGDGFELIQAQKVFKVLSGQGERNQFFLKFPVEFLQSHSAKVQLEDRWQTNEGEHANKAEVTVVGPDQHI